MFFKADNLSDHLCPPDARPRSRAPQEASLPGRLTSPRLLRTPPFPFAARLTVRVSTGSKLPASSELTWPASMNTPARIYTSIILSCILAVHVFRGITLRQGGRHMEHDARNEVLPPPLKLREANTSAGSAAATGDPPCVSVTTSSSTPPLACP